MPSMEYEEYEKACKNIREENAKLLTDFEQWLLGKGLAKKTIKKHRDNVDFYINHFMLEEEATPAKDGARNISYFLGYWFIRKAMWASPSSIKQNATSLKKFYTFMLEQRHIDADDFHNLKEAIKESAASFIAVHNHPSGMTDPSPEDLELTRRLKDAADVVGIQMLDHIIIGYDTYLSLFEQYPELR